MLSTIFTIGGQLVKLGLSLIGLAVMPVITIAILVGMLLAMKNRR